MPSPHPTHRWSGVGLLRASTAPQDLAPPPADLDLSNPADGARALAWLADLRQRPQEIRRH